MNNSDPRTKILDNIYGHRRSIEEQFPIDAKGHPLPWFTYPAIDYLSRLDFSETDFFEFGSGYGTLFWSKKVKNIISIEDDHDWYWKILAKVKKINNVQLIYASGREEYIACIGKTKKKYDVIIIDGMRYRDGSARESLKSLKKGGMIILDNSDWYVEAAKILRKAGLTQIDFDGFGPGNRYTWVTSFYIQANFKFKHDKNVKHNFSKGGRPLVINSD